MAVHDNRQHVFELLWKLAHFTDTSADIICQTLVTHLKILNYSVFSTIPTPTPQANVRFEEMLDSEEDVNKSEDGF